MLLLLLLLLLTLAPPPARSEVVLEEGYTVSTVLDGNKKNPAVNPFSLLPQSRSRGGILLLDSSASSLYALTLPLSQESEVRVFAGNGTVGFADGDPTVAMFRKPHSFAIDARDNVYVADQRNQVIRKISRGGVTTTIAGGYSDATGHIDGPAQNATLSNNFDVVYVPKLCALLISDRANRLIRQMNLKEEDCAGETTSGLGASLVSIIAVACAFAGSILGFVARPFLMTHEVFGAHSFSRTWKHFQVNLRKLIWIAYSDIKSAAAKSMLYTLLLKLFVLSLNYLSVVFRNLRIEKRVQYSKPVSLLDSDVTSNLCIKNCPVFSDSCSDLITFDEDIVELDLSRSSTPEEVAVDALRGRTSKIDELVASNVLAFIDGTTQEGKMEVSTVSSFGLVKRWPTVDHGL